MFSLTQNPDMLTFVKLRKCARMKPIAGAFDSSVSLRAAGNLCRGQMAALMGATVQGLPRPSIHPKGTPEGWLSPLLSK